MPIRLTVYKQGLFPRVQAARHGARTLHLAIPACLTVEPKTDENHAHIGEGTAKDASERWARVYPGVAISV